jgi:hypothetical protein
MKVSQTPDIFVSCLLLSLCLSVLLSAMVSRTLVVLSTRLLQTSNLLEKKKQMKLLMMRDGC